MSRSVRGKIKRNYDEAGRFGRLAWDGRIGSDAAYARGKRFCSY